TAARQGRSRRWTSHQARTRRAISPGFKRAPRWDRVSSMKPTLPLEGAMTKPARRAVGVWAAPLGSLLKGVVEPALAARGLGETSLVANWPEIVGAEIARYARPMQLQWPPRAAKRGPEA